jgi:hypothetical protein
MKNNNFVDVTYQDICEKELELRDELMPLRLKHKIGQLEKRTSYGLNISLRDIFMLLTTFEFMHESTFARKCFSCRSEWSGC